MKFFLGTHRPNWLADERFRDVLLFVSRRTLMHYKRLPRAVCSWALDSGGFTELSMHGRWTITAEDYAAFVMRCRAEVGGLMWAAPMDWMCEPSILAKTGLTVAEHQRRTAANYLELRALGADVIPVVQGWTLADYLRHVDDYLATGVDLRTLPVVGVGSVCRRNSATEVERILRALAGRGLRCHAFGAKGELLARVADVVASADSLAWSFTARRSPPLPGCTHRNCANCARYALQWRERQLTRRAKSYQLTLSLEVA